MRHLLPHSFKKIGLLVAILPTLVMVIIKLTNPATIEENKETLRKIVVIAFLVGLLIVVLSKQIREDEFINHCRLKSFSFAFLAATFSGIINISGVTGGSNYIPSNLIGCMLLSYLILFHILIWNNSKDDK